MTTPLSIPSIGCQQWRKGSGFLAVLLSLQSRGLKRSSSSTSSAYGSSKSTKPTDTTTGGDNDGQNLNLNIARPHRHRVRHGRADDHQPRSTSTGQTTFKTASHTIKQRSDEQRDMVYIVSLLTDEAHQETMTALRRRHFPPRLNKLSSHLTLFHALPGEHLAEIKRDLEAVATATPAFSIEARPPPFRMRKGVAISVSPVGAGGGDDEDHIHLVFAQLRSRWLPWLSAQDRDHAFRPHYTVQNKVNDPAVVDRCFREIDTTFPGSTGQARGLSLYLYDRGWWKWEDEFLFRSP